MWPRSFAARRLQPLHVSAVEFVIARYDADLGLVVAQLGVLADLCGDKPGVVLDGVCQQVALLSSGFIDGRLNVAKQRTDMAGSSVARQGGLDGAAALVAQHDDQPRAEGFDGEFDAAQPAWSSITFPALRTTKTLPMFWSKINSGDVRESAQVTTIANGC